MEQTVISLPSLERIAKALEKQNKLQEKAIEQSERMLKLQENYFKAEEERRNNFRKREEDELRNLMQSPKYWRDQDPETVKRVEEGFKRLYGYGGRMRYAIYYCGKKIKESESWEYLYAWLMSEGVVVEDRRGTHWLIHDYEIKEEE